MSVKKTTMADGSVRISFQSKRIKKSPVGLLITVIPVTVLMTSCTYFRINPTWGKGWGFVWLISTIALCVAVYHLLKHAIFISSHYTHISNGFLNMDGKKYELQYLLDVQTTRDGDQDQRYLNATYKGQPVKLTGWMTGEDANEVLKVLRNRPGAVVW